ncbi:hypothetical protein [Streptomyces sp. NPDC048442]|uniref:hypothetical protein n=1 Tax=Streptomyces sp. NPDC048442 TaxID=3154823 RepID=UPI00341FF0D0
MAALHWLVFDLTGSKISFPRFTYGLVAVMAFADPNPDSDAGGAGRGGGGPTPQQITALETMRGQIRDALAQATPENRLRPLLQELMEAAAPVIPWLFPVLPNVEPLVRLLGSWMPLPGGGPQARVMGWWESQLDGFPGEGAERLLRYALSLTYVGLEAAHRDLEERLTTAFLADLHHHGHWRWTPPPRTLILLDDTHTRVGRRLLDLLVAAYAGAGGPSNEKGAALRRPVVVATELSVLERPASTTNQVPARISGVDSSLWSTPRSSAESEWRLWLRTPVLHTASIAGEFREPNCPRGLPDLIGRLSAGRGGSARILREAAQKDLRRGSRSELAAAAPPRMGEVLLALPSAGEIPPGSPAPLRQILFGVDIEGGPSVTDALLRHLVPDTRLIPWLPRRAVALHPDDVSYLPLPPAAGEDWGENPESVRAFLSAEHWDHPQALSTFAPTISDRVLRELLLHQLSAASPTAVVDTYWTALHERARRRYDRAPAQGEALPRRAYLHHCLALGLHDAVVAELHQNFFDSGGQDWLRSVEFVCAAPQPPPGYGQRHPDPPSPCPACEGGQPDALHRSIGQLVKMLQKASSLSSVYADPDDQDNPLRLLLSSIGSRSDDSDDAVRRAAGRWPTLLCQGRRVPELEGDSRCRAF